MPGLFFGRGRLRLILLAGLALLAACVGGRSAERAGAPGPADVVMARAAADALANAEALLQAGAFEEAARVADSLFRAWREDRSLAAAANRALWIRAGALEGTGDVGRARATLEILLPRLRPGPPRVEAARRLATLRHRTGEELGAASLILELGDAASATDGDLLRSAVSRIAESDLERLALRHPPRDPMTAIVHAERARRFLLRGEIAAARIQAREWGPHAGPNSEEAGLAAALLEEGPATARIGVILPLSGRFEPVGRLLEEGIRLALESWRSRHSTGPRIELTVRDDRSSPERAVALASELEAEGVVALVGPVRSVPFLQAAQARGNPRLLMVGPTATEMPVQISHAYSLWSTARRERDVGYDLGSWIASHLGLRRGAVLYSATPSGRAAKAGFAEGLESSGGEIVVTQTYDPAATTFSDAIQALAAERPEVVFVPAESPQTVLQIAPQLFYFGVDRSVVAGNATWAEPLVVRRLDPFAADHRVVGTHVDRLAEGGAWVRFRDEYERMYNKSLRDNILPALGYDAVELILAAVERSVIPFPGGVSRAFAALSGYEGATGTLRPDPSSSTVARRTLVRMIVDGRLVPANRVAILDWWARARARADSVERARADSLARVRRGGGDVP